MKFLKATWYVFSNSILSIVSILILLVLAAVKITKPDLTVWEQDILIWGLLLSTVIQVFELLRSKWKEYKKETELKAKDKINEEDREEFKQYREDNEKFRTNYIKKKQSAQVLLNKLIQESLIKEEDILSVTKTLQYYQVIVYSYSFVSILSNETLTPKQKEALNTLKRKYPVFLQDLEFVRMGTPTSTVFIVNKNYLDPKLRKMSAFKKFLLIELEKIRKEEWNIFLECLNSFTDKTLYNKYKDKFEDEYLPLNFLLTESIMNAGHIGFVNETNIGLGKNTRKFLVQLLAGTNIKDVKLIKAQKVKIKEFFKRTDIIFLLDEIETKVVNKVSKNESKIKNKFNIDYVLEFSTVNEAELQEYLTNTIKVDQPDLAKTMIKRAKEFKEALENLSVNIE